MPLVYDQLALRKAHLVAHSARAVGLAGEIGRVVLVAVPGDEVRRDARVLARLQQVAEIFLVQPAERRPADLDRVAELALQALDALHEELREELAALQLVALRAGLVGAGVAAGQAEHVVEAVRLVPDLPVLDVPLVAVGPAAVVVAHGAGEDLGHLVEVLRDERVEVDLGARVLDRGAKAEEDVEPRLLARALQQVVGGAEHVVLGLGRVKVDERKDVVPVADALVGVDERPVVGARALEAHRADVVERLLGERADRRAEARGMQLGAHLAHLLGEVGYRQLRRAGCGQRSRHRRRRKNSLGHRLLLSFPCIIPYSWSGIRGSWFVAAVRRGHRESPRG